MVDNIIDYFYALFELAKFIGKFLLLVIACFVYLFINLYPIIILIAIMATIT